MGGARPETAGGVGGGLRELPLPLGEGGDEGLGRVK